MSFLVILICLAVQWFFHLSPSRYQWRWEKSYFQWMDKNILSVTKGNSLFTALALVLPILVVAAIVFALMYHIGARVGYQLLCLLLLWYCIDVTCIQSTESQTDSTLFENSYQKIFSRLFWFFVFGPVGLIFYVVVRGFSVELSNAFFEKLLGILDWVPVRLVGLSFALAGDFAAVFKPWILLLPKSPAKSANAVTKLGQAAVANHTTGNLSDVTALIIRALTVWLVVIALITLGFWLG